VNLAADRRRIASGEPLRVVVLVDRDDDDRERPKAGLERMAAASGLSTNSSPADDGRFVVLNRIVIEELESWFIGDPSALRKAFASLPKITQNAGLFRNPDNGGSWEALPRFLKRNGICKSSLPKIDAARRIAPHMNLAQNRSRSLSGLCGWHGVIDATRIPVNLELLTWAGERAGLDMLALVGRSPKLSEWESGELQPTLRQLEDFARAVLVLCQRTTGSVPRLCPRARAAESRPNGWPRMRV
jgi:hypothetical protein